MPLSIKESRALGLSDPQEGYHWVKVAPCTYVQRPTDHTLDRLYHDSRIDALDKFLRSSFGHAVSLYLNDG